MKFKFIEHTADVGVEAYGENLEESFENAALGFFEIMTDTSKVEASVKKEFEIESEDEKSLLYDFLEKFIIFKDAEDLVFSKFKVSITKDEKYKLKAEAWGEEFNPEKHEDKTHVKAITYHRMEVSEKKIFYIVDI